MLRGSQGCSALRWLRQLGLALRATPPQRWAAHLELLLLAVFFGLV